MKKLLALILCVMMFVSVIPTSAFADGIIDAPLSSANQYAREIKNMIKNTRENIETAYEVIAMDKVVYNSAKGMDDAIVNLVDGIAKPLIAKGKMTKAVSDLVKDSVRLLIDDMVADKMADNAYKYFDGSKVDPLKYAQTFADSVAKVLTDKDFQKGYEAVATYFALQSLVSDVNEKLADEYVDFINSADMKFDSTFGDKYPELYKEYIDTITDAGLAALILEDDVLPVLAVADPWAAFVTASVGSAD